jgi:predicted pyridoxine 5'-phosphate oxidase superfamily flavin-nucleotide-binding protein
VKIISAIPGTSSMEKEEVNKFLENKILLQIGTIDEEGDPNIHPVWFNYDKDREKLLVITPKITKKVLAAATLLKISMEPNISKLLVIRS